MMPGGRQAACVKSVNVGSLVPGSAKGPPTAINKLPVEGAVWVRGPATAKGASGVEGDSVGDREHHGGTEQAVYAFAREDLDYWQAELSRELPDGMFGENLTTVGIDPSLAPIGERWQVGRDLVLQVTGPRIPCKNFTARMGEPGWARRFTETGRPGAYLKVLEAGQISAGDPITILHTPSHGVDVQLALFALTIKPELLLELLAAGDDLEKGLRAEIEKKLQRWEK